MRRRQGTDGIWPGAGDVEDELVDGDGFGDAVVFFGIGDALAFAEGEGSAVARCVGACFSSDGVILINCAASRRVASSTTDAPGGCARSSRDCSMRRSSATSAARDGSVDVAAMSAASWRCRAAAAAMTCDALAPLLSTTETNCSKEDVTGDAPAAWLVDGAAWF